MGKINLKSFGLLLRMVDHKISISLKELIQENNENVTYNELVNIVNSMEQNSDLEDFVAEEVHFQTN